MTWSVSFELVVTGRICICCFGPTLLHTLYSCPAPRTVLPCRSTRIAIVLPPYNRTAPGAPHTHTRAVYPDLAPRPLSVPVAMINGQLGLGLPAQEIARLLNRMQLDAQVRISISLGSLMLSLLCCLLFCVWTLLSAAVSL